MSGIIKILTSFVAILLAVSLLSGCQGPTGSKTSTTATTATTTNPTPELIRPTKQETMALRMVDTIFDQYGDKGGAGNSAYINLREHYNTQQSGFLWSNFSGVGMQYYVCKLYPDDAKQKEIFRRMIYNFQFFRQSNPENNKAENSVKYHSARGNRINGGYGDCFFDDNIWVARNYLRAYEILGDEWYLEEAIRVNNWVLSGWNNELGGIVWSEVGLTDQANEQHLERGLSANACGIMVNAMLSQLVESPDQKEFHLNWAKQFYSFCKKMQNTPNSYDYWNGIHTIIENGVRKDGDVNRVHFSYNSGSMILANLLMYECAEDEAEKKAYMDDALKTAAAAKKTFYVLDSNTKKMYYQGDPWFAAILNEAYYELSKYDSKVGGRYLETFTKNVEIAYSNRDKRTKLCPYQAPWEVTWDKNESYVIHQIGFAQQAVIAALYSVESQSQ